MLRIALAMTAVFLLGANAPTDTSATWTLARTVDHGLEHAPRLQAVSELLKAANFKAESKAADYLPSLDVGATHGVSRDIPEREPAPGAPETSPYRSQFNVTLSQKIYDNGETGLGIDLGRIGRDRATLAALQAREAFVRDVAMAFYRLSFARLSLATSETKLKTVEKQRSALKQQVQQGFRTPRDLVRLDADVQKARSTIFDAEASVKTAVAALRRLAGIETELTAADFELLKPGTSEPELPALPTVDKTFEARLQKFADDEAGKQVELLRKQHGPQVFVTAAADYGASGYMGTGDTIPERDGSNVSAMVEFKYNLWDGGRKSRDMSAALAENAAAAATRRDELAELRNKLDGLAIDKDRKLASLRTAKALMAMERESYDYLDKAYREGKTTYLDLVTALDNLTRAQQMYDAAYFDLLDLAAQYRYYEGTTYETLAR